MHFIQNQNRPKNIFFTANKLKAQLEANILGYNGTEDRYVIVVER